MWWAIGRKRHMSLQQKLQIQLQQELELFWKQNDERVAMYEKQGEQTLAVQNTAIKQIQKTKIEYKYTQATKDMQHDWWKLQVWSMLWALRSIGVLN